MSNPWTTWSWQNCVCVLSVHLTNTMAVRSLLSQKADQNHAVCRVMLTRPLSCCTGHFGFDDACLCVLGSRTLITELIRLGLLLLRHPWSNIQLLLIDDSISYSALARWTRVLTWFLSEWGVAYLWPNLHGLCQDEVSIFVTLSPWSVSGCGVAHLWPSFHGLWQDNN